MAELVDARDLGSRGLRPWGFESPLSHSPRRAHRLESEKSVGEAQWVMHRGFFRYTERGGIHTVRSVTTRNAVLGSNSPVPQQVT